MLQTQTKFTQNLTFFSRTPFFFIKFVGAMMIRPFKPGQFSFKFHQNQTRRRGPRCQWEVSWFRLGSPRQFASGDSTTSISQAGVWQEDPEAGHFSGAEGWVPCIFKIYSSKISKIFTQTHNFHPIFWLNTKVANLLLGFLVGPLGHGVDSARLTTFQFGGLPVGGLWQQGVIPRYPIRPFIEVI